MKTTYLISFFAVLLLSSISLAQPTNDDCSGAILLTPSATPACNYTSVTFSGATLNTISCATGNHQDVWYRFVATEKINRIYLSSSSGVNHGFEVIDGNCAGTTLSCINNNGSSYSESFTSDQYIVGNTYYIRVYNAFTSTSSASFNICIESYPPPANDDCSNATVITPSVTPACNYVAGTFSGASLAATACATGNHQDVWYQFVATEKINEISLSSTSGLNHGFEVIDGSCTGSTLFCINNNGSSYSESYTSDQFVIGNTYYIRVYNAFTSITDKNFNICIESFPPPANDDCSNATVLTQSVTPACNYTAGTFSGASLATTACATGNHQDVWYQFVATEEINQIYLSSTSGLNHAFEVIDGSCSGTNLFCVNNNGSSYSESYTSDQFVIGNTYFIRVYNAFTSITDKNFNICIESFPPPVNDDCNNATVITPSVTPTCNYTAGTFSGASLATTTCATGNHQDVWYQFVATEEINEIYLSSTSGLNHAFEVIDGSCTGANLFCVNNNGSGYSESFTSDQFIVGNTYYIRVYNAFTSITDKNFNICIESFPPPANDDCNNATVLTPSVTPTCNYTAGTFSGASLSTTACATGTHQDVWYQFVATEEINEIYLSSTSGLNHAFEVIDGSCAGTNLFCVNNNGTGYSESFTSDQFVIGNTYYIRVYNAFTSITNKNFNICIESFPPPTNDDCSNATVLTPSVTPTCNYTAGTFSGASLATTTCATGTHQDVWYQFIATEEIHKISLSSSSGLNHAFEVIDGSCSGTNLFCVNNNGSSYSESFTSDQFVVGNTYYIRVYNVNTSITDKNFNICVESFPPPVNDDCSNATVITPSITPACNYVPGTFSGASLASTTCATGNHQDVWFQFVATAVTNRIRLSASYNLNHGFEVIDGSCTGTSILCVNNNSSGYGESNLSSQYVIGNTYYIRVYNAYTSITDKDFDICIESFPVSYNDDCQDAITIPPSVSPACNTVSGSFSGATLGTIPCEAGNHQDVWFQFVATEATNKVYLSAESGLDHGFEVINGNCTGTSLFCVDNNGTSFSEAYTSDQYTIGNTYYVRVYNSGTNLSTQDFDICVEAFPPPSNDDCSNAISITPSVSPACNTVSGTFSGAALGSITCETGNHQDVWFQFVATEEINRIYLSAESGLNHGFEVVNGSCTGTSLSCMNINGSSTSESSISDQYMIGNTYYIRVYNAGNNLSAQDFDICIEAFPPPANDDCSNATSITPSISPACNTVPGTFSGAALGNITCESGNHQDVWFQFVATAVTNKIYLSSASGLDHGFEVIDGSCTGTSLSCVDNNGMSSSESYTNNQYVIGNTYFIRVYNSVDNLSAQNFDICVEAFPAVSVNDDCSDAISITPSVSPACNTVPGTFDGSTLGNIPCETGNHQDVWFQFVATEEINKVYLSAESGLDHGFEVIEGNCTGNSLFCVNNNTVGFDESITSDQYTIGNTYYIRVYNVGNNSSTQDFDICVEAFPPPANDDCSNAISLTTSETCMYITGTFSGASLSSTTCEPGLNQDVWYTFTAINDTMTIKLDAVNNLDLGFELLDACNGSSLNCTNDNGTSLSEESEVTNLTIGNSYYVRVYQTNVEFSTHTFDICVFGTDEQDASLNEWDNESTLLIYPNPSNDGVFTIQTDVELEQLIVYDVAHRLVMTTSTPQEMTIVDLAKYKDGMYYIQCITSKGKVVRTVVKN